MSDIKIEERAWILAQIEIHARRYLTYNILATMRHCAQPRAVLFDRFEAATDYAPPLGIDVAVRECQKLAAEFDETMRALSALNLPALRAALRNWELKVKETYVGKRD